MLTLANEMTVAAGEMFFTGSASPEARTNLYQNDVRLNQLERKVRKQIVAHLAISGNPSDVTYSVLLISLVKDVSGSATMRKTCLKSSISAAPRLRTTRSPWSSRNPTRCGGRVRGPVRGVRER